MSGYIERAANQIADILMREGLDYTQTKAVFKQARAKAGLHAPKEHRGSPARLTLEEELRFIDQAYAQGGQVGLMMQVLLETGTRVSEFVALRVEDVSLAERAVVIEDGKGGKRREVPMRPELARPHAIKGALDGLPVVVRQLSGAAALQDIGRKADNQIQVRPRLIAHRFLPPFQVSRRTAAVLGRADPGAAGADGVGFLRVAVQELLDADLVLPVVPHMS